VSLLRLIVRQAGVSVGIGLACGVALAGAGAVLVVVMGVAAAGPARRSARADPMIALRED
jgi:hypothetical protein